VQIPRQTLGRLGQLPPVSCAPPDPAYVPPGPLSFCQGSFSALGGGVVGFLGFDPPGPTLPWRLVANVGARRWRRFPGAYWLPADLEIGFALSELVRRATQAGAAVLLCWLRPRRCPVLDEAEAGLGMHPSAATVSSMLLLGSFVVRRA